MEDSVIESTYPIDFRRSDAKILGEHLKNLHSVVIIGMKRVGISNFLRFFLYHKDITKAYINDGKKHLFIPVDLHDLTEREIFPFWMLTLKRIVDAVEKSALDKSIQKEIEALFLKSIQTQDLFLTIENVRKAILKIVESNVLPTLFLLRFDRIKEATTIEFYSNLQGLKDASHQRLAYVFTSVRSLYDLSPEVFRKASLSVFAREMYLKPAKKEDTKIVFEIYKSRYKLKLTPSVEKALFNIVDGYIQYLQLALIFLHEQKKPIKNEFELFESLVKDESINLQSEELWESLNDQEKRILLKINKDEGVLKEERMKVKYLWDTGLIVEKNRKRELFSPLFDHYLAQKEENRNKNNAVEFTKKEYQLFNFLKEKTEEVCEREKIIEAVWPEEEALGVSDWAIDRLVARVRNKLKKKKSLFEISTVKTRGYKLIANKS